MNAYIIEGGHPLDGSMRMHRAKNSVLPILTACLLTPGECVIHDCPGPSDVTISLDILRHLGCRAEWQGDAVVVSASTPAGWDVPDALIREIRSPVTFLGAILGRMGRAGLCAPGGCGPEPQSVDLHLGAVRGLDGHIIEDSGGPRAERVLRGADLVLSLPSVGIIGNAMLAAVYATGTIAITSAARESEIVGLQGLLQAIGAKVHKVGSSVITMGGGVSFHGGSYAIMGDRIVTATYLAVAASAGDTVRVTGMDYCHLSTVNAMLREAGCDMQDGVESIRLHRGGPLQGMRSVRTVPHSGFPTDARTPLMVALTRGGGCTVSAESTFESHYRHVDELSRMGVDTRVEGRVAVVYGVPRFHGARVRITDLRGGAMLAVAALRTKGHNELTGVYHIDRGYQSLEGDLRRLGTEVRRI